MLSYSVDFLKIIVCCLLLAMHSYSNALFVRRVNSRGRTWNDIRGCWPQPQD